MNHQHDDLAVDVDVELHGDGAGERGEDATELLDERDTGADLLGNRLTPLAAHDPESARARARAPRQR